MGVIPLTFLYLTKPLHIIDLWPKALMVACSDLHIMHHNIYKFTKSIGSPSFITKNPQHIDKWLWGFQAKACASTTTSYETSATSNNVTLLDSKCTLSTFESDENLIWLGAIDVTSSSTPPIYTLNRTRLLKPFNNQENKNLNKKNKQTKPTFSTRQGC